MSNSDERKETREVRVAPWKPAISSSILLASSSAAVGTRDAPVLATPFLPSKSLGTKTSLEP